MDHIVIYSKPPNPTAFMKKVLFPMFFFALCSSVSLPYFSQAQESTHPQPSSAEPGQKSTKAGIPLHRLSSKIAETVVFIYEDKAPPNTDNVVPGQILGTAFIVGLPIPGIENAYIPVITTAKHVIADRKKVLGRYTHISSTENPVFVPYDLEKLRKNGDLWEHPDEGVDIVAFRTEAYNDAKFSPFPIGHIASKDTFTQEHISIFDRVMIPCLMANYPGIMQNYPIFRDGSIALITEEPILIQWPLGQKRITTKQKLIFINSTLNEGFSGAPVFLWPGVRVTTEGRLAAGGKLWLIGIVHAFFSQRRQVIDGEGQPVVVPKPSGSVHVLSQENSGTGVIFPSWQLLDILQSESVKKRVQQITEQDKKN